MSDETPPQCIRVEHDGPIAVLTLCRPEKLNAWSWESARQLGTVADSLRFDDTVRAGQPLAIASTCASLHPFSRSVHTVRTWVSPLKEDSGSAT